MEWSFNNENLGFVMLIIIFFAYLNDPLSPLLPAIGTGAFVLIITGIFHRIEYYNKILYLTLMTVILAGMLILSYIQVSSQVYKGTVYSYILIGIFILSLIWVAYGFNRKMEKIQEATLSYNKDLRINPKDITALNNKGTAFAELKEYQKAIKCFDKTMKIDPKDAAAWHNKGVSLEKLGKHREALEYYDMALELDPKFENVKKTGKIILEN